MHALCCGARFEVLACARAAALDMPIMRDNDSEQIPLPRPPPHTHTYTAHTHTYTKHTTHSYAWIELIRDRRHFLDGKNIGTKSSTIDALRLTAETMEAECNGATPNAWAPNTKQIEWYESVKAWYAAKAADAGPAAAPSDAPADSACDAGGGDAEQTQ